MKSSVLWLCAGVLLPVHRVRGVHHAALLHAGGRDGERSHLLFPHRHALRLPGVQHPGPGLAALAGETLAHTQTHTHTHAH